MAKLKVTLCATEVVKRAVQSVMEDEFKDDVSDDYKRGFYDFGNAILSIIDKMTG